MLSWKVFLISTLAVVICTINAEPLNDDVPENCSPGTIFKKDCNFCRCGGNGAVTCTQMTCDTYTITELVQKPIVVNVANSNSACKPGTIFKKDCNFCRCNFNGKPICSTMHCSGYNGNTVVTFVESAGSQGTGYTGQGSQGSGYAGQGSQGTGYAGQGSQGTGYAGQGSQGSGYAGQGSQGTGYAGQGSQGAGYTGQGSQGTGYTGHGSQGTGHTGQGSQVAGNAGQSYQGTGYAGQGSQNTGYAGQGSQGTGYAGQGSQGTGYAVQGFQGTGYAGQGSQNTGYVGKDSQGTGNIGQGSQSAGSQGGGLGEQGSQGGAFGGEGAGSSGQGGATGPQSGGQGFQGSGSNGEGEAIVNSGAGSTFVPDKLKKEVSTFFNALRDVYPEILRSHFMELFKKNSFPLAQGVEYLLLYLRVSRSLVYLRMHDINKYGKKNNLSATETINLRKLTSMRDGINIIVKTFLGKNVKAKVFFDFIKSKYLAIPWAYVWSNIRRTRKFTNWTLNGC